MSSALLQKVWSLVCKLPVRQSNAPDRQEVCLLYAVVSKSSARHFIGTNIEAGLTSLATALLWGILILRVRELLTVGEGFAR